jgi:ankyrin repeat protein
MAKGAKRPTISSLYEAVVKNKKRSVSRLLETNALNADIMRNAGTLLSYCQDTEIAVWLIERGADVEMKNSEGNTPLADTRNIEMARTLVKYGADVDAVGKDDVTVLNKAASRGDVAMMLFLLHKRATRWNHCTDGYIFFEVLFDNFLLSLGMLRPFSRLN